MTKLHIGYTKAVEEYKDIENDFYSNDSLNNDLKSRFYKSSRRCSENKTYSCKIPVGNQTMHRWVHPLWHCQSVRPCNETQSVTT